MIQTETTPNPNSLKFLSEKTISDIGTEEFQKGETKKLVNPFIKELLDFDGVELVLLSKNFLSVKKQTNLTWNDRISSIIGKSHSSIDNIILERTPKLSFNEDGKFILIVL